MSMSRYGARVALAGGLGAACLVSLAGCEDPAFDRGVAPPVVLSQTTLAVPLHGYAPARGLRRAVASLAPDGDSRRVDATIETASQGQAAQARALLVELGFDPARIAWRNDAHEDIVLSRSVAVTTPCGAAVRPAWLGDAQQSLDAVGHCVQANGLAQMVADPRDLVHPVPMGPTNGAVAARAVGQWEGGTTAGAPQANRNGGDTQGGADDESGSGGSGGGSAQSAHSAGTADNPLLSTAPLPGAKAE